MTNKPLKQKSESEVLMSRITERHEKELLTHPQLIASQYGLEDATNEEVDVLLQQEQTHNGHLSVEQAHRLVHGYRDSRTTRSGFYE